MSVLFAISFGFGFLWGFFVFFFNIYLLAVLGLHCYSGFSLVAETKGYSLVALHGLPIAMASLIAEHGLRAWGLW